MSSASRPVSRRSPSLKRWVVLRGQALGEAAGSAGACSSSGPKLTGCNSPLPARRMRSGFTAGPCSLLDRRILDSANFQELPPSLQDSHKLDHHTVPTRAGTEERTQVQVETSEGA